MGFSVENDKLKAPFFIIHLSLLTYVYLIGNLHYQVQITEGIEFAKHYVNTSLLVLIANITFWWIRTRKLLRSVLILVRDNDRRVSKSLKVQEQHAACLKKIKHIIFTFLAMNYINATFIYVPNRMDVTNAYSMSLCVGLEPLTESPNYEICRTILFAQEITIMSVCLYYQVMLVLLIAHTAAIYEMLVTEIDELNNLGRISNTEEETVVDREFVAKKIPEIIRRHTQLIVVVGKLRALYSMPIGIDFGSNAVCIAMFYYLPLPEFAKFMPVFAYCLLSFFLYCHLGQKLINAAENFEKALYCCGWENFPLKEKKCIYMMFVQAQRPVDLLAADIIPVNISTFATTLQGLYKFVTVLKF